MHDYYIRVQLMVEYYSVSNPHSHPHINSVGDQTENRGNNVRKTEGGREEESGRDGKRE